MRTLSSYDLRAIVRNLLIRPALVGLQAVSRIVRVLVWLPLICTVGATVAVAFALIEVALILSGEETLIADFVRTLRRPIANEPA